MQPLRSIQVELVTQFVYFSGARAVPSARRFLPSPPPGSSAVQLALLPAVQDISVSFVVVVVPILPWYKVVSTPPGGKGVALGKPVSRPCAKGGAAGEGALPHGVVSPPPATDPAIK